MPSLIPGFLGLTAPETVDENTIFCTWQYILFLIQSIRTFSALLREEITTWHIRLRDKYWLVKLYVCQACVHEYSWIQPGRYWLFIKRAPTGLLGFAYLISFAHFHLPAARNWRADHFLCGVYFFSNKYLCFSAATEGITFDRHINAMFSTNCHHHKFPHLRVYLQQKIALTAVWPPFGQPAFLSKESF